MNLTVVITTRNRKKDLMECVDSLSESSYRDFETIIIDDSSSDGTESLQMKDFNIKNLSIFHSKQQLMMVGARNMGARKAMGEWVMFVDDDNVLDREFVKNMWDCCQKYNDFGIIGAPVYFFYDRKRHFSGQKFSFITGSSKTIIDNVKNKEIIESDAVPNIFMTRKDLLKKTNYFDPSLIQSLTDIDFVFSVKKLGLKSGICQDAVTYHKVKMEDNLKPRFMGGIFNQKSYCLIRNRMVLIKRYGKFLQKIIYLIFFSWLWPLFYSILSIKYKRFDLVKYYLFGFKDGLIYFLTGQLKNSLPFLSKQNV